MKSKKSRRPRYSGPRAIIVDNGSCNIVAGWAASDSPRALFPNIVGTLKHNGSAIMIGMINKSHFVGDEAWSKRGLLIITHPIRRGIITSMDNMEKVWHHTFYNELRIDPSDDDSPFLFTVTPFATKSDKEKITQIMFETFNILQFYMEYPSKLALLASGRTTGIVLQSGNGVTYTVPIYNGKCILNAIQKVDIGGRDITKYLIKLLAERGYSMVTSAEKDIVREIKKRFCYVALNFEKELKICQSSSELEKYWEGPDGEVICVSSERFKCTEALFKPFLVMDPDVGNVNVDSINQLTCLVDGFLRIYFGTTGSGKRLPIDVINMLCEYIKPNGLDDGIHHLIYRSIMQCDVTIRKDLFSNIVLCGGNTMFYGIADRLKKELKNLVASNDIKVKVIAPPERKHSVWIGGSVLTTSVSNKLDYITKNDYDTVGPTIIHKKCFK